MNGTPSDYLAAERTFLAWIRTGLALMGFGFVVARFGLFLEALHVGQPNLPLRLYGNSFWFGTALISLGVIVNLAGTWNHIRLVRALQSGNTAWARPSALAIAIAILLAALGFAMAINLFFVHGPQEKSMNSSQNGIVTIACRRSVEEAAQKLEGILQARGVKLFALVDHSGEAEKAGMQMRPTKLLIFGSPKAGTPLMIAAPSIAIDLPLKILIWEDSAGKIWISYNAPAYLEVHHGVRPELIPNIAVIEALASSAAE